MLNKYMEEREGQRDFYESYLSLIDRNLTMDDISIENTDGILNGNLLEFKLYINDLNEVLFQAIKYLSSMRIKGNPVPRNILLVSLNEGISYIYDSYDYLQEIETVYTGRASTNNAGFIGKAPNTKLNYLEDTEDERKLIDYLKEKKYTRIHIDENNVVGWAKTYYRMYPQARKADFIGDLTGKVKIIGEIREPNKLKEYIYRYKEKANTKFQYLMDQLNDDLQKKNLGAFYTNSTYAKKSLELVREAIERVPKGNDYIILDRCAGTGNLEQYLTKEELSHTIVSTVEYYEYKVLLELLGDKVRYIIPPTEKEDTFNMGLVKGSDALTKDFINNPILKRFVDDPSTTIILFENPPYAETTSIEHQKKKKSKKSSTWKSSYVVEEMKKEVKKTATNDLGNAFIWSGFKYFLRQSTDSYIVFSPVKYWKAQHLLSKRFIKGFAFNRRHFHTNINATVMAALWSNEDDENLQSFQIEAFDIKNDELKYDGKLDINKVHKSLSKVYFDRRKFEDDEENGIWCDLNGLEAPSTKNKRIKNIYNDNILGYMAVYSSGFDNPDLHSSLLVAGRYDGNGFFLRKDNYKEKLPMFAASRYIRYNNYWTERARVMKSGDGSEQFFKDVKSGKINQFLLKTLLFTTLEPQNHIRSLTGTDKRFYRNELCLDTTNGKTVASEDLKELKTNETEKKLIAQWKTILNNAKQTENYNDKLTYGIYQITNELNTYYKDEETDEKIFDYPELNGNLKTLKTLVRDYYLEEIVPTLFEYEFLK